ncbi:MAG: hypothetical protein ACI97A_001055 [Planctomycetota bacterium]|jgi:hypothetical protein
MSRFLVLCCASILISITVPLSGQSAEAPASAPKFTEAEIDQLVAPMALYPDSVVAQMLMASTYPLEIVQAARWAKENQALKGEKLDKAIVEQAWDPSVKSLVAFPDVLKQMSDRLDWTQKLGDAVLAQQADVMDGIQRLRLRAKNAGHLKDSPEQKVIVEQSATTEVVVVQTEIIRIEPAKPQIIYVPTYNPTVVYGTWPYPAAPPAAYYPPGYVFGAAAFGFAVGVAASNGCWGHAWGGCNWGHGHGDIDIDVNRNRNVNRNIDRSKYQGGKRGANGSSSWKHNPQSRRGVRYRDQGTASKFGRDNARGKSSSRDNFRGRANTGRANTGRTNKGRANTGRTNSGRTGSRSGSSAGKGRNPSSKGGAFGGASSGSKKKATRSSSRGSKSRGSSGRSSGGRSRGGRSGGGRR